MRRPVIFSGVVFASVFTGVACNNSALEERVLKLEAQLQQLQPAPVEAAPADGLAAEDAPRASPDGCIGDMRPVENTVRFLVSVEQLMEDYVASAVDTDDELACVTEAQISSDSALRRKVQRSANKKRDTIAGRGYALAYTWASDLGRYRTNRFGCHALDPQKKEFTWVDGVGSAAACANHERELQTEQNNAKASWRLRTAAPTYESPPELMRRMKDAEIEPPKTLACLVADVRKRGAIECQGSDGVIYAVNLSRAATPFGRELNRGDIVGISNVGELRRESPAEPWTFGEIPADGLTVLERSRCCQSPTPP